MGKSKKQTYALGRALRYWQRKLRLLDWDISVEWRDEAGMADFFREDSPEPDAVLSAKQADAATDADGIYAVNSAGLEARSIQIVMKRGAFDSEKDAESALVHELWHLVIWPLAPRPNDRLAEVHEEQIVRLAEELLMEFSGGADAQQKKAKAKARRRTA